VVESVVLGIDFDEVKIVCGWVEEQKKTNHDTLTYYITPPLRKPPNFPALGIHSIRICKWFPIPSE